MKILIVDDDAVFRRILQTSLEKSGHEVIAAADGNEAWQIFDHNPMPVIISDWMMPGLNGLALCRKVRRRPQTEYTYFILLTMRTGTGKQNYHEAMDAGVDDFLAKPSDRDELSMRLQVAERILTFTTQVRQLKSILPICMYCKKIRDDKDYWQQIESYIHAQTGTDFSHGVCPECYEKKVKPQMDALRAGEKGLP